MGKYYFLPDEGRGPVTSGPMLDPGLRRGGKKKGVLAANGFTLIEMMVALAVFSLAALALIRLEGATLRSAGMLDETVVAQMVARNVAVEALTDAQPPVVGAASGSEANGGRAWTWTRRVTPLGDAGALRIDVAVAPGAGQPIARLMVVRPGA